jgi:hypothetical protein
MRHTPDIIEVDRPRLEEVLGRVEQALSQEDIALIRAVFQSYLLVTDLVEDKNTTLRRLRQVLFGASTEKTAAVLGQAGAPPQDRASAPDTVNSARANVAAAVRDTANAATDTEPGRHGHGRNGVPCSDSPARRDEMRRPLPTRGPAPG